MEGKHFATTLVALAALAATGAFAQVTVYGRLDAGYANTKTTTTSSTMSTVGAPSGAAAQETLANGVQSHNSVSSLWGIKGTEDLGGGMNAFFQLEADVYPANGSTGQSGSAGGLVGSSGTVPGYQGNQNIGGFNRTSKLGVNGGFGSIAFGRDYNSNFKLIAATDVHALSRVSTVTLATFTGGSTQPNLVMYSTPVFNGFQVNVDYGNQDNTGKVTAVTDITKAANVVNYVTKVSNVTATYTNGPLFLGAGVGSTVNDSNNAISPLVSMADAKVEGSTIVGSYDFGNFKLVGNWISSRSTAATVNAETLDSKEYNLGAVVPMGKITLTAQYARKTVTGQSVGLSTDKTTQFVGTTDAAGNSWVLGADYSLSAKTAVFVKTGQYAVLSGTYVNDTSYDTKTTSTVVGVKTVF